MRQLLILTGLLPTSFASGQTIIRTHQAMGAGNTYAEATEALGDVNGDGFDDYAIVNSTELLVHSGRGGALLYTVTAPETPAHLNALGEYIRGVGDVTGDGKADFAWLYQSDSMTGPGDDKLYLFSGAGGALVHSTFLQAASPFGPSLQAIGDVNGDGLAEVLRSRSTIRSAATGALQYTFDPLSAPMLPHESIMTVIGYDFSGGSDLNGDGTSDILMAVPAFGTIDLSAMGPGAVYVYSGVDGSYQRRIVGPTTGSFFGFKVAHPGDINGDGRADLVVLSGTNTATRIHTISGADDSTLNTIGSPIRAGVEFAGDVDGDGVIDTAMIVAGTPMS